MSIALISDYLETYQGRDKFLRTLSYMAKLATLGTCSKETEQKFKIFSSQMSTCRITFRLLDDIPIINHVITYQYQQKEPDWLIRWTELMQIIVDIIFCRIDHISWAGEHKLIKINNEAWNNASTWFWIISLHLSLLKSLRKLKKFNNYKTYLGETNCNIRAPYDFNRVALKTISKQRWNELLTCIRLLLDISYAISYLPPGILWGNKLKTWHIGALGTLSSIIGLYQALSKLAEQKKYL